MAGWFSRRSGSRVSIHNPVRLRVLRAPSLSRNPMPPRTTRKSDRRKVSDRTMVGTAQPLCLSASGTEGRRYESTMNLRKRKHHRVSFTLLGLDGKTISPVSYRRRGGICLDIPFYRTGLRNLTRCRISPRSQARQEIGRTRRRRDSSLDGRASQELGREECAAVPLRMTVVPMESRANWSEAMAGAESITGAREDREIKCAESAVVGQKSASESGPTNLPWGSNPPMGGTSRPVLLRASSKTP